MVAAEKYSYRLPLREENRKAKPEEHKSLMSVFVISLANGTADPSVFKQPAQRFENTLYQQSDTKRTTEFSGLTKPIQHFTAYSVR